MAEPQIAQILEETKSATLLEDRVPQMSEMPEHVTFDYWQHEYWRLGQMYQDLVIWQKELERWEQELIIQSKAIDAANRRFQSRHNFRNVRGGARGGRGRESAQ